jgi:hypothetical protein
MRNSLRRDFGEQVSSTGHSNAIFRFSEDGKVLHVHGIRIDQVTDVWNRLFKTEGANWVIDSKYCSIHY